MSEHTKNWFQNNVGSVVVNLVTVVLIGFIALWFKNAVAQELNGYVTRKEFERLEKVVIDGRVERMAFQREVLDRLVRSEERAIRIEDKIVEHMRATQTKP